MSKQSARNKATEVALEVRIAHLVKERGEQIEIGEIGQIVSSLLDTLHGDLTPQDLRVYSELESLARYIYRAKQEISEINPEDIAQEHIPKASVELDAIGSHLENATGTILDATEIIETVASNLGGEDADKLGDAVTEIYEACNFQDLTGQRITKIIQTLQNIENRVDQLLQAFGHDMAQQTNLGAASKVVDSRTEDEKLLNGPATPGTANSQEDIDALLASFD
jgi:chemotaxis protein CheZ